MPRVGFLAVKLEHYWHDGLRVNAGATSVPPRTFLRAIDLAQAGFLGPTGGSAHCVLSRSRGPIPGWAEDEENQEARDRLLEVARQYDRLATALPPRPTARMAKI